MQGACGDGEGGAREIDGCTFDKVVPEVGLVCIEVVEQCAVVNLVNHLAPPLDQRQLKVSSKGLELMKVDGISLDVADRDTSQVYVSYTYEGTLPCAC